MPSVKTSLRQPVINPLPKHPLLNRATGFHPGIGRKPDEPTVSEYEIIDFFRHDHCMKAVEKLANLNDPELLPILKFLGALHRHQSFIPKIGATVRNLKENDEFSLEIGRKPRVFY